MDTCPGGGGSQTAKKGAQLGRGARLADRDRPRVWPFARVVVVEPTHVRRFVCCLDEFGSLRASSGQIGLAECSLDEVGETELTGYRSEGADVQTVLLDSQDSDDIAPLAIGDFATGSIPAELA